MLLPHIPLEPHMALNPCVVLLPHIADESLTKYTLFVAGVVLRRGRFRNAGAEIRTGQGSFDVP